MVNNLSPEFMQNLCRHIRDRVPQTQWMEPMAKHTTLQLGGPAQILAQPATRDELAWLLKTADEQGVPVTVIGNGSNLLVRDGGIRGLVIRIGSEMGQISVNGCEIHAQGGATLARVAQVAAQEGLEGLAFAGGIPGTVGGGVYMNAGAYGGEMCQVVTRVEGLTRSGEPFCFSGEEMAFGYRRSRVQQEKGLITDVYMALVPGSKEEIFSRMNELNRQRRDKQPLTVPSAGSTFKRPEGYYAAALIDECGLKGLQIGGAQVSEKHAGFLTNGAGGTAADFIALIAEVQKIVLREKGVRLETEVEILGEDTTVQLI